jgi:ribonuclease R
MLPEIAAHSSERERAAAEAERDTVDFKKVEYMAQFVGEEFEGIINGVTSFGIFVELDNGIEGLVHVSSMDDDYYQYVEEQYALIGERTHQVYRLGSPVKVKLDKVNLEERNIDFVLLSKGLRAADKPRQSAKKPIFKDKPKDKGKEKSKDKPKWKKTNKAKPKSNKNKKR